MADAIQLCGLDEEVAAEIASEIFLDSFESVMDICDEDLADAFKTFAGLTAAQGQIRLLPAQKNKIKAFVQWVKDLIRTNINPSTRDFPIDDMACLLRRARTHKMYVEKSDTLAKAARPEKFTKDMEWEDWYPSFENYLRAIPGRNGVPLKYVIREQDEPDPTENPDFLDDYVAMAPLQGEAFVSDAAEVHTLLVNLITGNTEAESLIKINHGRNGRKVFGILKLHYEGQGIYSNDITRAENDLNTLFYAGERKPHMWWVEFERRLNLAFQTFVKHEGRVVHSDEMKLRILLKMVKADFLKNIKATISVELSRQPVTYTYHQALRAFKMEVMNVHPDSGNSNKHTRRIKELGKRKGGQDNNNYIKKTRPDSKIITLKNGKRLEYHAAFRFPPHVYEQFKPEHKELLRKERREYAQRNSNNPNKRSSDRTMQELQRKVDDLESLLPSRISIENGSRISQVTTGSAGGTIMGGRNDQIRKKSNSNN